MLQNLVVLLQKVCEMYYGKFLLPEMWTKVHQNPLRSAMHYAPVLLILPYFIALDQTMYDKSITKNFLPPPPEKWAKVHQIRGRERVLIDQTSNASNFVVL